MQTDSSDRDTGASLRDRATRPADQAPAGLGDTASVPSADALEKLRALRTMCGACGQPFYVQIIDEILSDISKELTLYHALICEESIEALAADIACAIVDPRSDVVALRHSAMVRLGERLRAPFPSDIRRAASAIEARRATTPESGVVGDESAVAESETPTLNSKAQGEAPNE